MQPVVRERHISYRNVYRGRDAPERLLGESYRRVRFGVLKLFVPTLPSP